MPSRSIIRTGVGPHREPRNRFPAIAAAINLLAARAARVQSRRNLSRSLSPKLDHSHSITRFDRSRTGPKDALDMAAEPSTDEIMAAIRDSGYLMEQEVATQLEGCGLHVRTNVAFEDPDEGKSREIDVAARKRVAHDDKAKLSAFI